MPDFVAVLEKNKKNKKKPSLDWKEAFKWPEFKSLQQSPWPFEDPFHHLTELL